MPSPKPASPTRIDAGHANSHLKGYLYQPIQTPAAGALALTHGAGGDCNSALLVAVAEAFSTAGFWVLRYDLPYRQARPKGPPSGNGARDREGILAAASFVKQQAGLKQRAGTVPVYLSGQSYGGRQSSMVAAERPEAADGLLLLSYPLHPPGKPDRLRTDHFPSLTMPVMFVHGTRDPFGSPEELEAARQTISGKSKLHVIEGAGHGVPASSVADLPQVFVSFVSK